MPSNLKSTLLSLPGGPEGLVFGSVSQLIQALGELRADEAQDKSIAFANYVRQILRGERPWSKELRQTLLEAIKRRVSPDSVPALTETVTRAIDAHNRSRKERAIGDDSESMVRAIGEAGKLLFVSPDPVGRSTRLADELRRILTRRLGLYRNYSQEQNLVAPVSVQVLASGQVARRIFEDMFLLSTGTIGGYSHPLGNEAKLDFEAAAERFDELERRRILLCHSVPPEITGLPMVFAGDRLFVHGWLLFFSEEEGHRVHRIPSAYIEPWLSGTFDRVRDGEIRSREVRWSDSRESILSQAIWLQPRPNREGN